MPVTVSFDATGGRAAFRLFHPKGNIITAEIVAALSSADGMDSPRGTDKPWP